MSSVFFDRERIAQWLGERTVAKARSVGAVSNVKWQGDTLSGDVQGSQPRPYLTRVRFRTDGGSPSAEGKCTCPVGRNCKHVAALLLAELDYHDEMDHITQVEDDSDPATSEVFIARRITVPGAPPAPSPSPSSSQGVRPELVSWLERFRARARAADAAGKDAARKVVATRKETLAYRLNWSRFHMRHEVVLHRARCDADGVIVEVGDSWGDVEGALLRQPRFVSDEDLSILRGLWLGRSREDLGQFVLRGTSGAETLQKLIATGRLFFDFGIAPGHAGPTPLARAADRLGRIEWEPLADERLRPVLRTEPRASMVLPTEPVWYVDGVANEAGVVPLSLPFQQLPDYLAMPPISLAEAPLVASVLREIAPELPLPPTHDAPAIRVIDVEPVPVLTLNSHALPGAGKGIKTAKTAKTAKAAKAAERKSAAVELAAASFDYDGVSINADSSVTLVPLPGGDVIHIRRRYDAEKKRLLELRKTGLQKVPTRNLHASRLLPDTMLGLPDTDAWSEFVNDAVPDLVAKGWRVTMAPEFRYNVIEIDAIDGTAQQAGDGWFDLEMGIRVGERNVRLEPLLADLFRRDRRWLSGALERIRDDEPIELKTEENKRLRLRADRLKPVVRVLVDLFDSLGGALAEGAPLRVPAVDAGRLDALHDTGRWQFSGDDSIRELARRLQAGPGLREVPVPRGLKAELRGYQHQGLNWMQFLREQDLAGVLADDMGLGKTVQTLAHVLAEKEAGRLTHPALIVVPTTLVHNWREETRRFAPELKVLVLNGPQRKERFQQIGEAELILTTYALLWRDQKVLAEHDYHLLILDEAQYVKNATTKAAQAIRGLRARHRLGLTGTPLENHLGELWSQFDFSAAGLSRQPEGLHATLAQSDRKERRRRAPRVARAPHPAVHAAPSQGRGREGTAAEDDDRVSGRSRRRAARPVRNRAHRDAAEGARGGQRAGARAQPHHRARCVAEAAPGVLRSTARAHRQRYRGRRCHGRRRARDALGQARSAAVDAARADRGGTPRAAVLAVHRHARVDRRGTRRSRDPVRHADGRHGRSREPGRAVPAGRGAAVPDQPEGRRRGAEPDRRRHGDPLRPVVEPGRREPGDRPRASAGTGQAGIRVQVDRGRQHRGKDRRVAGAQGRARRQHSRGRSGRRRKVLGRRSRRAVRAYAGHRRRALNARASDRTRQRRRATQTRKGEI
ncbi:hypothetical protein OKW29_002416 [Paraburkholderia sp. CI3]